MANPHFTIFKDAAGEYRWHLKAANGEIIAVPGEGFTTKESAKSSIAAVKRDAPVADILDITKP